MTDRDSSPGSGTGPPWAPGDGKPEDWRAYRREMWRRRRAGEWGGEWRGRPRPFFGCVFAIVFLVVVWAVITTIATAFSTLGPIPVVIAIAVVIAALVALSGGFRRSAGTLDSLVDATAARRSGRLHDPRVDTVPWLATGPSARARLQHHGRAPRGERGPAPHACSTT